MGFVGGYALSHARNENRRLLRNIDNVGANSVERPRSERRRQVLRRSDGSPMAYLVPGTEVVAGLAAAGIGVATLASATFTDGGILSALANS